MTEIRADAETLAYATRLEQCHDMASGLVRICTGVDTLLAEPLVEFVGQPRGDAGEVQLQLVSGDDPDGRYARLLWSSGVTSLKEVWWHQQARAALDAGKSVPPRPNQTPLALYKSAAITFGKRHDNVGGRDLMARAARFHGVTGNGPSGTDTVHYWLSVFDPGVTADSSRVLQRVSILMFGPEPVSVRYDVGPATDSLREVSLQVFQSHTDMVNRLLLGRGFNTEAELDQLVRQLPRHDDRERILGQTLRARAIAAREARLIIANHQFDIPTPEKLAELGHIIDDFRN